MAKNLGKSAPDYKRIARDQDHMARIAALGCLICRRPAQAHHVRIIVGRTMGRKVSDLLVAPLCPTHHLDDKLDSAHGWAGEQAFWSQHYIDIGAWILKTLRVWYPEPSEQVAAAIAAIEENRNV